MADEQSGVVDLARIVLVVPPDEKGRPGQPREGSKPDLIRRDSSRGSRG